MYALVIFAVAFVVRLLHIWQIKSTPLFDVLMGDANGYDLWAQRLAAGDWVGTDVFYQAPLYPYFLGGVYAIFGRDLLIVRLVQAAIGSASCVLLGQAAGRLFSRRVGLIAGLSLAVWAPAIFFDALLQKSVLDMFCTCLVLWFMAKVIAGSREPGTGSREPRTGSREPGAGDREPGAGSQGPGTGSREPGTGSRRQWLGLGGAMAALALSRENALLLIAVVGLAIVLRWFDGRATERLPDRNSIRERSQNGRRTYVNQLLPFVLGLGLVFAPVAVRNYAVDGRFYLTTSQFGSNFYIGNNPNADGTYASIRFGRGAPEFERLDAKEVAEESAGHALSPAEVSSFWFDKSVDFITSQPSRWLRLEARKIVLLFNRAEMIDTEAQESYAEYSWPLRLLGWFGHFGVLVPLAVIGVVLTWPDRRRLRPIYAVTLTYAASVVLFFVFARYRYPLVPLLMPFAVVGLMGIPQLWRRRDWLPLAAAAAMAVFANWPVLNPTLMMAITENNLGTALQDHKRYDEAVAHHERAIQLMPGYAPAYNNLGAALRAAGRLDDAVARYRQALELKPDFASASYNLANALLEQGKSADSADSFRRSLEANPNSVEAHNNLGIALAQKGDTAGAMNEFRAALAIDERSVHAHRNLGNMLYDMGRRDEALQHLRRAIEVAPDQPDAVYDLGTILLSEQQFAPAASRFEAALRLKPDWAEAHNNLGIALASQGKLAEALKHFERAVELKPALQDARANRDQARAAVRK